MGTNVGAEDCASVFNKSKLKLILTFLAFYHLCCMFQRLPPAESRCMKQAATPKQLDYCAPFETFPLIACVYTDKAIYQ